MQNSFWRWRKRKKGRYISSKERKKRGAKLERMMRITGKAMEELWECEEREAMGMEEQEEWEEVEEDLEWGIRDRYSEEGGLIDWWMERWRNGKCQGDPPLFIIEGWAEIKWLSRGFWEMVETGEMIVLINGWSGEETRREERRREGGWKE